MKSYSDDVLSLFSGAGGFSYGFSLAGLIPLAGAELDADACATYQQNVGSTCHQIDLATTPPSFFKQITDGKSPFAIVGGPPCQGFSTAGARKAEDPRNRLIFNYLRIVAELNPRWFIFENVEGLLTSGNGAAVHALLSEFLSIGYSVRIHKVNFAANAVPQTRKRVLIIGNSLGLDFDFPQEKHGYNSGKSKKLSTKPLAPSLDEALSGLGHAARDRATRVDYAGPPSNEYDRIMREGNDSASVTDHYHTTKDKDSERFALLKQGQTMKDLPEDHWHGSFKRRAFRRVADGTPTEKRGGAPSGIKRLIGKLNALTITGAATREFIHPHEDRPLTIRECARLQSFPDRYQFVGNAASKIRQIGNAVPPLAAEVFARHLQDIDGRFGAFGTNKSQRSPRLLGYFLTEASAMSPALQRTEALLNSLRQEELFL